MGQTCLLWRTVVRVQNRLIRHVVGATPQIRACAQVDELETPLPLCKDDVEGLHIPMHQPRIVECLQPMPNMSRRKLLLPSTVLGDSPLSCSTSKQRFDANEVSQTSCQSLECQLQTVRVEPSGEVNSGGKAIRHVLSGGDKNQGASLTC